MDEVRLCNVYSTLAEIQATMNNTLTGSESGLVAYYKMNDGSGTSLADSSSNSNTATLNNMTDADWVVSGVGPVHESVDVAMHNLDDDTDVTVAVSSSDTGEGTVSPATLTFTEDNWNTAQTVTATGVNDNNSDGHQSVNISVSADNVSTSVLSIHNLDDDKKVKVALASSHSSEATVSPAELSFTKVDWNTAQTVTVTGVDDGNPDGKQQYQISLSSRLGQNSDNFSLYNLDDDYPDTPQIAVTGLLSNSGTISAQNSEVTLSGGAAMSGGSLDISDSTLNLTDNFTKTGGTLTSDTATLKLTNSASINSNNAVSFKVLDLNNKVLTLGSGTSDLTVTTNVTLDEVSEEINTESGDLTLTGGFTLTKGKIASSGGVIELGAVSTIATDGTMNLSGGGLVLNAGLSVAGVLHPANSPKFTLHHNALALSGGPAAAGGVLETRRALTLDGITFA